jgi:hypothetical protein
VLTHQPKGQVSKGWPTEGSDFGHFFFPLALQPNLGLGRLHEISVSLQLLDLGQSVGLLGRVISSSQGLYLYTNTEKRTHNTDTKDPCPE